MIIGELTNLYCFDYWIEVRSLKRIHLLLPFLILKSFGVSAQGLPEFNTYNLGCSSGDCVVESWQHRSDSPSALENERVFETQFLDASFFSKMKSKWALARFPSAQSCLTQRTTDTRGYDLLRIDWAEQKNSETLQVCLFRIHSAISNVQISEQWFVALDFSTLVDTRPKGHFREGWSTVHATWNNSEDFPADTVAPLIRKLFFGELFSISVLIDSENLIRKVSIDFNTI